MCGVLFPSDWLGHHWLYFSNHWLSACSCSRILLHDCIVSGRSNTVTKGRIKCSHFEEIKTLPEKGLKGFSEGNESTQSATATFHTDFINPRLVSAQDRPRTAYWRATVKRHLRSGFKPAISPIGSQEGEPNSNAAIVPHGSSSVLAPGRRSECEPWREVIVGALKLGLSAQRIYQDLIFDHSSEQVMIQSNALSGV